MSADYDLEGLRASYSRFLKPDRLLLSGHSHQAWPDAARDAMNALFDDASELVDEKWGEAVFPKVEAVGRRVNARMGFDEEDAIAFGKSTHELVFRLLSSFWGKRPKIVTTSSEFHSLYRQLRRLEEEGFDVTWVDASSRDDAFVDRLLDSIRPGVDIVAVSAVLFEDAFVVPRLREIAARAVDVGALTLIDAYHAFNVVPIEWGRAKGSLFVTAGGYKYAGFGDGCCWLRVPDGCDLRPVDTGWFADFAGLTKERGPRIHYGEGGARFAGATFDASAIYRADAALANWDRFGLDVAKLRAISVRQTRRIVDRLDELGPFAVASSRDDDRRGGFVTVRAPMATRATKLLRERGVFTDARNDLLRVGPAPYLTDDEIDRGVAAIAEVLREA